jgi:LysM repeat protein
MTWAHQKIITVHPTSGSSRDGNKPKKSLFFSISPRNAFWGSLAFAFAVIVPFSAQAGIFSLVSTISRGADSAAAAPLSVQNISVLDPTAVATLSSTVDTQVVDDTALLSDAGPLGSAADFASSTQTGGSDQINTYTVRRGDTLGGIANMFNVSVNTVLWANDLKKGAAIHEGDQLVILPISGVQYVVKKGDTISGIAKRYGGDPDEILAFNNIDQLSAGDTIIIPDGEAAPASQPAKPNGKPAQPSYAGYYAWPVSGGRLSQRLHGHNGVDIAAPAGTAIMAAAPGTVILARSGGWNGGYGSYVVVKHSNGTQTLYAHMSSVSVNAGQSVGRGQMIGGVGNTGHSTGNHLHFEVRGATNPFAHGRK